MSPETPARKVIEALGLQPHPEGGWFRETFRDVASTAIFYLLERGQVSAWHRVKNASETWHHYAGGPLRLRIAEPSRPATEQALGPDVFADETPQVVVPVNWWQSAEPLGDWTLVGCTVAPPFEFASFEMAPPGWEPPLPDASSPGSTGRSKPSRRVGHPLEAGGDGSGNAGDDGSRVSG